MHVVVVGNGVAGTTIAGKVASKMDVELYADEPYGFYSRIKLPQALGNDEALAALPAKGDLPYLVHKAVVKIDRDHRTVTLDDGSTSRYDKLVLATGSRSRLLSLFNGVKGVSPLRTIDDARRIGENLEGPVVVLGGGLLGIEAAVAISRKGVAVTVCEAAPHILARQLDSKSASLLRAALNKEGLEIVENAMVDDRVVDEENRIVALTTKDGRKLACRTLILSLGVIPETTLAKEVGLSVDRGIVVDEWLTTSDPSIMAVGDCAQFSGKVPGIIPVALRMAEAASGILLGEGRRYDPPMIMTRLKSDVADLVSIGVQDGHCLSSEAPGRYEAYFVKDGKLVGAILYGSVEHLAFVRKQYDKDVDEASIVSLLPR